MTNTGDVELSGIQIDDPMLRKAGVKISCPQTSLVPGQSMTCSALYVVRAKDMAKGKITNVAKASANSPTGKVASADDTAIVPTPKGTAGDASGPGSGGPGTDGESGLPDTGGPHLGWLGGGLALLIAGFELVRRNRRHRNVRTS